MTGEEKLSRLEAELISQTGCRAEEIAGVYQMPIPKPVVNARMGAVLRRVFAAEDKCTELVERVRSLEYALAAIITSADKCDVASDGVGVPLVSVDHRLIEDARRLVNSPRKPE